MRSASSHLAGQEPARDFAASRSWTRLLMALAVRGKSWPECLPEWLFTFASGLWKVISLEKWGTREKSMWAEKTITLTNYVAIRH